MARLLRELVRRRPSSNNFIATLTHRDRSILSPPLGLHQPILGQTKLENGGGLNPRNEGLRPTEEVAHLRKSQIYPSFSFGYFLDPIVPSGLIQSQMVMAVEADMEHPAMIWADSVKKKRKKKMNKHKYKKLRKRLRFRVVYSKMPPSLVLLVLVSLLSDTITSFSEDDLDASLAAIVDAYRLELLYPSCPAPPPPPFFWST
ncbi:hypothetical protein Cgig2_018213 [Carnegiea gigantea]|uniref:Small ribosomal subunit protein mS38 n=1 Tax=Carnegiea gigantea TaxID=171969 RepID=A0A9Q1KXM8_9CARY|nr:hypothetical protein Cgig2_018213 [Carnegiea gigantea]